MSGAEDGGGRNREPYRATKLWEEAISLFSTDVPLSRHRKNLKSYDNCFRASEAITWFHFLLKKTYDVSISRNQTISLLQKFYKNRVFESVVGNIKNNESPVETQFKDNSNLYRLVSRAVNDENSDFGGGGEIELGVNLTKKLPNYTVIFRPISTEKRAQIWETTFIERLVEVVGYEVFTSFFEPGSINGEWIGHNIEKIGLSGFVQNLYPKDDLPLWLTQAMKCVASWPNDDLMCGDLPSYSGFEWDVFSLITEFFSSHKHIAPLLTFDLYDPFITTFIRAQLLDLNSLKRSKGQVQPKAEFNRVSNGLKFGFCTQNYRRYEQYPHAASDSVENLLLDILTPRQGMKGTATPKKSNFFKMRKMTPRKIIQKNEKDVDNFENIEPMETGNYEIEKYTKIKVPLAEDEIMDIYETAFTSSDSPITRKISTAELRRSDIPIPTNQRAGNFIPTNQRAQNLTHANSTNQMAGNSISTNQSAGNLTLVNKRAGNSISTNQSAGNLISANERAQNVSYVNITNKRSANETFCSLTNERAGEFICTNQSGSNVSYVNLSNESAPNVTCNNLTNEKCYFYENAALELSPADLINHPKYAKISTQVSNYAEFGTNTEKSKKVNYKPSISSTFIPYSPDREHEDFVSSFKIGEKLNEKETENGIYLKKRSQSESDLVSDRYFDTNKIQINKNPKRLLEQYANSPSTSARKTVSSFGKEGEKLPNLLSEEGNNFAISCFRLLSLLIPPKNRRALQFLLRCMAKISENDKLKLSLSLSNHQLVVNEFHEAILCSVNEAEYDKSLILQIVSFLTLNDRQIFDIGQEEDFKKTALQIINDLQFIKVEDKVDEKMEVDSENRDKKKKGFCTQISVDEYESQRLLGGTSTSLRQLLDSYEEINNEKERKHRLKKFRKEYPHIFSEKFGGDETESFKKLKLNSSSPFEKKEAKKENIFRILLPSLKNNSAKN